MKLDISRLLGRNKRGPLGPWPRIVWADYAATPISAGTGASRFSSPSKAFRVLYAASDFRTAFAEAIVRDRLRGKMRRYLYRPHLEARMVTQISSKEDLHLLDLTGDATYDLGIDTDASRAKDHTEGQSFSERLHASTQFDGILYDSRLTTRRCVAIYDRAFPKLVGSAAVELMVVPEFEPEVQRLGITIRRRRGTGP